MQKEKAAEMFGTKTKNVEPFHITTPSYFEVDGWIYKGRDFDMGSMIIETVDGEETLQFVRSMPKIHYLNNNADLETPCILNKEDGTSITQWPLIRDDAVVDVCFKTRLMPEVQEKFMNKVDEVITHNHFRAVENERMSLSYELYGYRNAHEFYGYENPYEVEYKDLDIELNLDLITVLDQGMSLPTSKMFEVSGRYNIPHVMEAFETEYGLDREGIPYYAALSTNDFSNRYSDFEADNIFYCSRDLSSLYSDLENFFEELNNDYREKGGSKIIAEGSVWHYGNKENHMLKNKALSVKKAHIEQSCGSSADAIAKAFYKADENGINLFDDNLITSFIQDELLEDSSPHVVYGDLTSQKITRFLEKERKELIFQKRLKELAKEVINEVGESASPADKMRAFSQMFPDQRKLASKMYQVFVKM